MLRRSKYGAKRVQFDGINFHSIAEANRYAWLSVLAMKGEIRQLELQPEYKLAVNGLKICSYRADFKYIDAKTGCEIVEDVKGYPTPIYKLKKALVKAIHNIDIVEIKV